MRCWEGNEDECVDKSRIKDPLLTLKDDLTKLHTGKLVRIYIIKRAKIQIPHCVQVPVGKGELILVDAVTMVVTPQITARVWMAHIP